MSLPDKDLILLVEDNDIDAMMLERILKLLRPDIRITRSINGEDALEAVKVERPDLILMDIRMPRMDGREALTHLKNNSEVCDIPVVMMSTSSNQDDISYCYRNHANAYLVKALSREANKESVESLLRFWFETVTR